ncbi:GNAT family protein [Janibacter alkaliphilus]|uniref:RimJ/RimL family protein N-acetyltransferase n=1 Tax=Janibacter alkaliphilus TaxID=1069963 RepID=A0A852XBE7_9MICO|nr:RimJ/RimL family protein N-acetyltransferase [Janibacter alkaliphilus]
MPTNALGQPVGDPLPGWVPPPPPGPVVLTGRTCRLEPLDEQHVEALHQALDIDSDESVWSYYPTGPHDLAGLTAFTDGLRADPTGLPFVVLVDDRPVGTASYLRIAPADGSIEVGNIVLGTALQRTTAATEAMYLLARHALDDLGYRRYEWKCDALNAPSVAAAQRLGFTAEGVHRQARVYRGRNRDTAWFSILDREWPDIRSELERWLAPDNHDDKGRQRTPLRMPGR